MGESIDSYFQSRQSNGGIKSREWVRDIVYGETRDYKVAVSNWKRHSYNYHNNSGVEWATWLEVLYMKKEGGEIKKLRTELIVTRDMYDGGYDKDELWGLVNAHLRVIEKNRIKVTMVDREGYAHCTGGPFDRTASCSYSFDLR